MAHMYHTICETVKTEEREALSITPDSLYHAFEQVTDGRKSKGKRYPLPLLLTLLLLRKLAGETTINGIANWITERKEWVRTQLDWPKRFPTEFDL